MQGKIAAFVLALLGFVFAAGAASAACVLQQLAELPVTMEGLRPVISAKIDGADVRLFVDTGSFFSMLSPAAAARLGLHPRPLPFGFTVGGVTGSSTPAVATAKDFSFLGYPMHNVDFLVAEHGMGEDGLVGQNLLNVADVEFDFGDGVIRLMRPKGCGNAELAYWAGPTQSISVLPIEPIEPPEGKIRGDAMLNGKRIRVVFDTGAYQSMLSLRAARAAGIKMNDPGVVSAGVISGVGRRLLKSWIVPVASFSIDGEVIKNTRLRVADVDLQDVDMLLGSDFFLSHRIYVSKSQRKIYFTYNGGPVFDLNGTPGAAAAKAPPPAASASAEPAADEPKDAAGFGRRAAAWIARREYDQAIADDTRAIALEPTGAAHFYDRGIAHVLNRQPVLAMDDFDLALKLKPDDAPALMMRGRLRMAGKDQAGARADFEAALKLDPAMRLQVAAAYVRAGLFEDAVADYDQWIASHPSDEDLAGPLNGRCWARALWDRDLDKALADCNRSLGLFPGSPSALESRGLVRLRLGDNDRALADFNAALKLTPKSAWATYGRGVAELRKGQKDAGAADIAAATSLSPHLPDQAKGYGLAPPSQAPN